MAFMGWFKRFLFGAPQDKLLKNMRSSDQAPASADSAAPPNPARAPAIPLPFLTPSAARQIRR